MDDSGKFYVNLLFMVLFDDVVFNMFDINVLEILNFIMFIYKDILVSIDK